MVTSTAAGTVLLSYYPLLSLLFLWHARENEFLLNFSARRVGRCCSHVQIKARKEEGRTSMGVVGPSKMALNF